MFFGGNSLKYKKLLRIRILCFAVVMLLLAGCGVENQDQAVPDFSIAYVKRPVPVQVDQDTDEMVPVDPDVREATDFNEGGDVYLRERAAVSAAERNITLCITDIDGDGIGTGDVRDLETSYDGSKLIFSLRLEDLTNGNDVPRWNLYEYDAETEECPTRVITGDFAAAKGDDVAPYYLPDGRIVFSSNAAVTTRESLLNEGKSQFSPFDEELGEPAVVLHVMNADGTNIKQISFNQSHDLDASVLSSGEIVFSRWDGARDNTRRRSAIRLYTIHPDGTGLKALYGLHDADVGTDGSTVQFLDPRELSDGRVLAMLRPFTGSAGGGAPVAINVKDYTDMGQPTVPNLGILAGPGQVLAINYDVRTDDSISPAGRYRSVYPLADGSNRALVSWSQCRLHPVDPLTGLRIPDAAPVACPGTVPESAVEAFPLYGIYVYDFTQDTQLPVVFPEENIIVDEPVVLAPRPRPAVLIDKVVGLDLDQALAEDEFVGVLHIRSVYDFDGNFNALGGAASTLAEMADPTMTNANDRPARYLRIVKATAIPDPRDDATEFDAGVAFGAGGRRGGMREIIGYATIEPDGSVMTKVPANVPLSIQVLDQDGRRIGGRHLNWIQVRAGETLECNGCHTHNVTAPALPVPHGYNDAPPALNAGALTSPYIFPGTKSEIDGGVVAQMGETMAQARIRFSCTNASSVFLKTAAGCPELSPNPDPVFFDQWAQPGDAILPVLDLRYASLDVLMAAGIPATAQCTPGAVAGAKWDFTCRTIINYEDSIHPLWSLPRTVSEADATDRTCTACHSNQDVANADAPMVPAAQLDLGDGLRGNDNDPARFKSYQELFIRDQVQWQLVNGALVPVTEEVQLRDPETDGLLFVTMDDPVTGETVQVIDPVTMLPIPVTETRNVPAEEAPSMRVGGAVASSRFFDRFTTAGVGTVEHADLLTPAELRLLYEWLDIGAQYFNNTFDAPS